MGLPGQKKALQTDEGAPLDRNSAYAACMTGPFPASGALCRLQRGLSQVFSGQHRVDRGTSWVERTPFKADKRLSQAGKGPPRTIQGPLGQMKRLFMLNDLPRK